jgi:hypothetical protein
MLDFILIDERTPYDSRHCNPAFTLATTKQLNHQTTKPLNKVPTGYGTVNGKSIVDRH